MTATEPRRSPLVVRALRRPQRGRRRRRGDPLPRRDRLRLRGGGRGFPGPGTISITAHVVASVFVIVAQRIADRRDGLVAVVASVAVLAAAALLLATQWWG